MEGSRTAGAPSPAPDTHAVCLGDGRNGHGAGAASGRGVDKNGKISKQEWIKFMEAEFHRLDVEKRGEIDRKQLLQSTVSVGHVRSADLGK